MPKSTILEVRDVQCATLVSFDQRNSTSKNIHKYIHYKIKQLKATHLAMLRKRTCCNGKKPRCFLCTMYRRLLRPGSTRRAFVILKKIDDFIKQDPINTALV